LTSRLILVWGIRKKHKKNKIRKSIFLFCLPDSYKERLLKSKMLNFTLVGPGVGVDAAIGSISWPLIMNDFIMILYYLELFIAFRASFSLNFLNFRTRGSKNVDAIRNDSLKNPNSLM